MGVNVAAADREKLRPLFAGFPGLHGCVDAALEGTMGSAWTDDLARPAVALIHLDFFLLSGDPRAPAAEEAVRTLPRGSTVVTSGPDWEPLVREIHGDAVGTRVRVGFAPGRWERARLARFVEMLPDGFALTRVDRATAARFAGLADSLVYNFPSLSDFVKRGVAFGIQYEGRFVSGCSSFAVSSRSLEFEIQTHPDFRSRGLASAAAAAMISYCVERGVKPCWDAHNEVSAALAAKLGFVNPSPYEAYELTG